MEKRQEGGDGKKGLERTCESLSRALSLSCNSKREDCAAVGLILYCKLGGIQRQPSFLPQVRLHSSFHSASSSVCFYLRIFSFCLFCSLSLSFSFPLAISPTHNERESTYSIRLICPPGNNLKHETKGFLTSFFSSLCSSWCGVTSATTAIGNISLHLFSF